MRLTIQLCTYNRAQLLERVLAACFDQMLSPEAYEVVLVNDGSSDNTPAVIERARRIATCRFTVVQQPNGGLAKARNAGLAVATGERIAFIDDDILPTPRFAVEHLSSDERAGDVVVRGAVINTESFDALPTPQWTP
ncbi:MAG: glycosyltransferase family 2 protein, partial [Candidatus Eremiobacteraeota bacterium]|nr:glycosyltransferase family 2 protein [Candidatus Eremiobacteraeota bacterium]